MNAVISSRTPEGDSFRCPICGESGQIEPSRPPGDVPCPTCGQLIWLSSEAVGLPVHRLDPAQIEKYLQTSRRRPMFGVLATISRRVGRVIRATRRRWTSAAPEPAGVYDHWLDG